MQILNIAIAIFIIMESANVYILYFMPDSKIGNGVAVFNSWFKAKEDVHMELFARYMANWVAGVKLIFILLLLAILFFGDETLKVITIFVMILSISTYYFRLNPIIKKLDDLGEITPVGYSKILFLMITGFMVMFTIPLIYYFFVN